MLWYILLSLHVCSCCVWFRFSVASQEIGWEERLQMTYFVSRGTLNLSSVSFALTFIVDWSWWSRVKGETLHPWEVRWWMNEARPLVRVSVLCFLQCLTLMTRWQEGHLVHKNNGPLIRRGSLVEQVKEEESLTQVHVEQRPLNGSSTEVAVGVFMVYW